MNEPPALSNDFALLHRAIRQETIRLAVEVDKLTEINPAVFGRLASWLEFFLGMVGQHQNIEDELIFSAAANHPAELLKERFKLNRLATDLTACIQRLADGNSEPDLTQFKADFDNFCGAMLALLTLEEELLASSGKYETSSLEGVIFRHTPLKVLALLVPWLIETLDKDSRWQFYWTLPDAIRILYENSWKTAYEEFTNKNKF